MNLLNKVLVNTIPILPKSLVRVFANKYIAGDNLNTAVETVKNLNSKKFMVTMDVLGESINSKGEAIQSKNEQLDVLTAINKNKLDSNLSIKLTMLGLKSD